MRSRVLAPPVRVQKQEDKEIKDEKRYVEGEVDAVLVWKEAWRIQKRFRWRDRRIDEGQQLKSRATYVYRHRKRLDGDFSDLVAFNMHVFTVITIVAAAKFKVKERKLTRG